MSFRPAYIEVLESGRLAERIEQAEKILESCTLCPRQCRVNRLAGETGFCKTSRLARIASIHAHFGEERPLVGKHGSGTIFVSHCNLLCIFCQNYDISHLGWGEEVDDNTFAHLMLTLQAQGCHNINIVTPSHVVYQLLCALRIAAEKGLQIPLVYNSGGYDSVETLRLLDGIVDIYMPDFKFWDPGIAEKACNAPDYPDVAKKAVMEMHRQVGDLVIGDDGLAKRGLLVRHLVLPSGLSQTREVMRFLATRVSKNTYVNVMSQYRPCGKADKIPELSVPLSPAEFHEALAIAREEGIRRLDRP